MGCGASNCLIILETLLLVIFTSEIERIAIYERTKVSFHGLSINAGDISRRQCAIRYEPSFLGQFNHETKISFSHLTECVSILIFFRCLASICRGIYLDDSGCKNLFETNDVPESDRNQYNRVSLISNTEDLLMNGNDSWWLDFFLF